VQHLQGQANRQDDEVRDVCLSVCACVCACV
jgi:hypothetical protein